MVEGDESLYVTETGFLTDTNVEDNETLYPLMSSTKLEEDQNIRNNEIDVGQIKDIVVDCYDYLNKRFVKNN